MEIQYHITKYHTNIALWKNDFVNTVIVFFGGGGVGR